MRAHGAITIAVAAVLTTVALGQEPRSASPRYERQIETAGPGPNRLVIHSEVLAGGAPFRVLRKGDSYFAEGGLNDLRLFTPDGRPVPYLLVQPPSAERTWVPGRVLPIAVTRKTSGFEVDLGAAHDVDMLRVEGLPVPHLKRLTLEGSGDRARWTMLLDEATLFDLPDEKLRQEALGFAAGEYRYLRVTWNDANSGRLPPPSSASARRAAAIPPTPAMTVDVGLERRPSEPGRSRYRIRLPAVGLPIVALELRVGGGHVYRTVVVSESRFGGLEAAPFELGRATLARITRDGVTASALRVPIATPAEPEIDLTIDDGANAPLDVGGIELELAQLPWIYFEAPAGRVIARYGDHSLPRPSYDLEAVRASIDIRTVKEARWSEEASVTGPAPEASAPATPGPGPTLDTAAFRHSRPISDTREGLVAVPLDAHVLAYSRGPAVRFADVRILDRQSRQIPYLLERRDEPLEIPLSITPAAVQAASLKDAGGRQRSVYAIAMPFPNLPPGRLVIETTARVFQRTVRLGAERAPDRHRRDAWFDVQAADTWRHADEGTPPRPLVLPLTGGADTDLRLVIDEGDNAPLPISRVRLLLPSYRLRFYAPASDGPSSVRLVYGRADLASPQYDLALLAPRVMGASASEAATAAASAAASTAANPIVSPRTFWIVLGLAVLVLVGLIVRLINAHEPGASSSQ